MHALRCKQHAVAASLALQHHALGLLGRCLWGWRQAAQAAGLQALHIKGMREYQALMGVRERSTGAEEHRAGGAGVAQGVAGACHCVHCDQC